MELAASRECGAIAVAIRIRKEGRMHYRFRATAVLALACALVATPAAPRKLHVCADPASVPSRADGSGSERRIGSLVVMAVDLRHDGLSDHRKTPAIHCDVIIGMLIRSERLRTTEPGDRADVYIYRSRWLGRRGASLDDPRLRSLRIGVAQVGQELAGTPAPRALARRGIVAEVIAFPIEGDRPVAQRMIEALKAGKLDVAVLWTPQDAASALAATPIAVTVAPGRASSGVQAD